MPELLLINSVISSVENDKLVRENQRKKENRQLRESLRKLRADLASERQLAKESSEKLRYYEEVLIPKLKEDNIQNQANFEKELDEQQSEFQQLINESKDEVTKVSQEFIQVNSELQSARKQILELKGNEKLYKKYLKSDKIMHQGWNAFFEKEMDSDNSH